MAEADGQRANVLGDTAEHVHTGWIVIADMQNLDLVVAAKGFGHIVFDREAVEPAGRDYRYRVLARDRLDHGLHAGGFDHDQPATRLPLLPVEPEVFHVLAPRGCQIG